ncbi:hypothetical protein NAPIS_ORF02749 [Vairimorpha apis BRL 01]|uniref:Uncharacterized protein n=1 Tax=Vairimorpha apis BRL 01 TaxID=1037528 RepID=T0M8G7_9MICR|nr:hypothetical protein NAPIS_ORF02749 [Vairimorpha apis BRL 01]
MGLISSIDDLIDCIHKDLKISNKNLTLDDYDKMIEEIPNYKKYIKKFGNEDFCEQFKEFQKEFEEMETFNAKNENENLKRTLKILVDENYMGEFSDNSYEFEHI